MLVMPRWYPVQLFFAAFLALSILSNCSNEAAYEEKEFTDAETELTAASAGGGANSSADALGQDCDPDVVECVPGGNEGGGVVPGGNEGGGSAGGNEGGGSAGGNEGGGSGSGDDDDDETYGVGGGSEDFTVTGETATLDIVVVVDNSGSMGQEHDKVKTELPELLTFVQDADWRIVLRTTDASDSIEATITKGDDTPANQAALFETTVDNFGTNGSGNERGVRASFDAIDGTEGAWLRNDSTIAFLVVSDEDNCSNGSCSDPDETSGALLTNKVSALGRTWGDTAIFNSLVRRNSGECPQAARVGQTYINLATSSNGTSGAICDEDYGPSLTAISAGLGESLGLNYKLSKVPIPGSVSIEHNGVTYSNEGVDFALAGRTVALLAIPVQPEDQITISYTYFTP